MPSGIYKRNQNINEYFWTKVDKNANNGCWEWNASLDRGGYGVCNFSHIHRVHRLSWIIHFGPIPEGKQINHICHNRKCVNPLHLYAGTQKDNMNDMWKAGRHKPTCNRGKAKLDIQEVIGIRIMSQNGYTYTDIAKLYNVKWQTIQKICNRERWRDI